MKKFLVVLTLVVLAMSCEPYHPPIYHGEYKVEINNLTTFTVDAEIDGVVIADTLPGTRSAAVSFPLTCTPRYMYKDVGISISVDGFPPIPRTSFQARFGCSYTITVFFDTFTNTYVFHVKEVFN